MNYASGVLSKKYPHGALFASLLMYELFVVFAKIKRQRCSLCEDERTKESNRTRK